MKKTTRILSLLLAVICLSASIFSGMTLTASAEEELVWPEGPTLEGEAGILIDVRTGTVLFDQNGTTVYYPASITKLMTALITLESVPLTDVVTFSEEAVNSIDWDSCSIGAIPGEQLTVEDCLYALLLKSANDAANALAEHVAGSQEAFAEMMNARAAQIGCTQTHFTNAHGLHNDDHYTTCYDMALILREVIKNETFLQISSAPAYEIDGNDLHIYKRYLHQEHRLMMSDSEYTYPGTLGGKLGYTPEAGNTLATYVVRGNMELIAVSMKTNWTHYSDSVAMFDYGFNNFTTYNMVESGQSDSTIAEFLSADTGLELSASDLTLSSDSWVTIPNTMSLGSLQKTFTLNEEETGNVIADITYSYAGKTFGQGQLLLVNGSKNRIGIDDSTAVTGIRGIGRITENGTIPIEYWIIGAGALALLILLILLIRWRIRRRRRRGGSRGRNGSNKRNKRGRKNEFYGL